MSEPTASDQQSDAAVIDALLQLLAKGLRALKLYPPNNPMFGQAADSVRAGFAPVWDLTTRLVLKVTDTGFAWEDHEFPVPDKSESIAWVLFRDGIRSLTFTPGVEDDEVIRFLGVINEAKSLDSDAEDDLITLLWQQHFEEISYTVAELAAEGGRPIEKSEGFESPQPAEHVRAQMSQDVADEESPTGVVSPDDFETTLYFLEDHEIRYLLDEVEREYEPGLHSNVLAMLLDVFELEKESEVRDEIAGILGDLLPHLLGAGDFGAVSYLLKEVRVVLERVSDLDGRHQETLKGFAAQLSRHQVLVQVIQTLDEASVPPTEEELGELFRELTPEAIETLLARLPELKNETAKELLERTVDRLAQAHPQAVTKALSSSDTRVLISAAELAGRLRLSAATGKLGRLLAHEDVPVRLAGVAALAAVGSAGAMQHLEATIDDDDRDVRVAAVRALGQGGHQAALQPIEAAVLGRVLRSADLSEKRAFFEAYGTLAGDNGVDRLAAILLGKGLLKRKADADTRACAAMALGRLATPAARSVLEKVANDKEPLVRNAANQALRGAA